MNTILSFTNADTRVTARTQTATPNNSLSLQLVTHQRRHESGTLHGQVAVDDGLFQVPLNALQVGALMREVEKRKEIEMREKMMEK